MFAAYASVYITDIFDYLLGFILFINSFFFILLLQIKSTMDVNSTFPNNSSVFEDYYYDVFENFDFTDEYADLTKSLNTVSLVVYSLTFVIGVLGNSVVIWAAGFKMKKTVNTVWFLNLAVADLLFTMLLPLSVTYLALDFHWPFKTFMCKMNTGISFVNMYASVYFLVVISVDRCMSVVWPVWIQNNRNVRKASWVSLAVWILALILSSPYYVFRDTRFTFGKIACYTNYLLSDHADPLIALGLVKFRYRATAITRFILGFVFPFTAIVFCYAVLIYRVCNNRTLAKQSARAFKIIVAIIIAFFLCWAPFHIFALLEMIYFPAAAQDQKISTALRVGIPLTTSLAFINSCLNPILYVFMGQDFKDRVCKSILEALETAFQEDSSSNSRTEETSQGKDKPSQDSKV